MSDYSNEQVIELAQLRAARDMATELGWIHTEWPWLDQDKYLTEAADILGRHFDLQRVLGKQSTATEKQPPIPELPKQIVLVQPDGTRMFGHLTEMVHKDGLLEGTVQIQQVIPMRKEQP